MDLVTLKNFKKRYTKTLDETCHKSRTCFTPAVWLDPRSSPFNNRKVETVSFWT